MNRYFTSITRHLYLVMLTLLGLSLSSCSDDDDYSDVDGLAPEITLDSDQIHTEPGRQFTISGTITDADGIKSISLINSDMYLDKTIDLLEYYPDSLFHTYNLSYNYTAGDSWTDDEDFPVRIVAEDVGGRTTEAVVTVTADGDFTSPTFVTAPSSSLTVLVQNPKLSVNTTVSDNKNLSYLVLSIPDLDIYDSLSISGTEYTFSKTYDMPTQDATYTMTLTVGDSFGNTTSTSSTISVSELPDFEKLYLADVDDAASLNSDVYGVPMLIEHTGEYQYRARYYNQKAGTGIRFIPQKTDFQPICFGVDESTGLLTSNPDNAEAIVLEDLGYYEIDFNTVTGEYQVEKYTPTTEKYVVDGTQTINFNDGSGDQTFQICLAGSGLPGTPDWTTNPNNSAFILQQDTSNPYLLYREMELEAGTSISFTISATHIWGWWPEPYWRFDGSDENEANVKNGGDNMNSMEVPATGTYRFEFDYSLLRSRIILVE